MYDLFTGHVSWEYSYTQAPRTEAELSWLVDTGVEYVPMVFGLFVNTNWNASSPAETPTRCYLHGSQPRRAGHTYFGSPDCTDGGLELIETLKATERALGGQPDNFVKIKRLMGANEPWWGAKAYQEPINYVE